MHRFSRTRQIRRCRNLRSTTDGSQAQTLRDLRDPTCLTEKCNIAFGWSVPAKLRSALLSHDDLFCRMCGVIPGDIDDLTDRRVSFHIEKIKAENLGGEEQLSNLQVLCSTCYRGTRELQKERKSDNWLLSQIGGAGQDVQRIVLEALLMKFADER
jgi:5-methylcytosine-specific restriction endonuclease McrA